MEYFRIVEVMRDYGMYDRAEAPQYYPPVETETTVVGCGESATSSVRCTIRSMRRVVACTLSLSAPLLR